MEAITNFYYENNAQKLHRMVDRVIKSLKFHDIDVEDFYSLANEVFTIVLRDYDKEQDFDGFLYSSLYKKFCTEMTGRTRDKRCTKEEVEEEDEQGKKVIQKKVVADIRLDAPIKDGENSTYGDLVADKNTVETEVIGEEKREEWHNEVKKYLKSLSPLQREIAFLISDNFTPDEICEELHITMSHYNNSVRRIFADEKTKILIPLVEKGSK